MQASFNNHNVNKFMEDFDRIMSSDRHQYGVLQSMSPTDAKVILLNAAYLTNILNNNDFNTAKTLIKNFKIVKIDIDDVTSPTLHLPEHEEAPSPMETDHKEEHSVKVEIERHDRDGNVTIEHASNVNIKNDLTNNDITELSKAISNVVAHVFQEMHPSQQQAISSEILKAKGSFEIKEKDQEKTKVLPLPLEKTSKKSSSTVMHAEVPQAHEDNRVKQQEESQEVRRQQRAIGEQIRGKEKEQERIKEEFNK